MDMVKFKVTNRYSKKSVIVSERELDAGHFDVREHEIELHSKVDDKPVSIIEAIMSEGKTLFPIFHPGDLEGLRISTSGHYYTTKMLTTRQKIWLEQFSEAQELGLA